MRELEELLRLEDLPEEDRLLLPDLLTLEREELLLRPLDLPTLLFDPLDELPLLTREEEEELLRLPDVPEE